MYTQRRRVSIPALLVGLPVLANVASFVVFAPLFAPGAPTPAPGAYQRAGAQLGLAVLAIEVLGLAVVAWALRGERKSLRDLVNWQAGQLRTYLVTGLLALPLTLVAGWLYARGQAQMGIELHPARLGPGPVVLWYLVTPLTAAVLEELIWRGYALPRLQGPWRSLLLTGCSFAFFHGLFPLPLVATLLQGLVWGWAYRRSGSTVPGMVLHLISRYLALVPGFG